MNKTCLLFLIFGLVLFLNPEVSADLVAFPTGDAAWTVDITPEHSSSSGMAAQPNRQIQRAEITQVGGVKRIVLNWTDGKTTEKWTLPGLNVVFEQDPRNGVVTPFQDYSLRTKTLNSTLTYDSFAFGWVSPQGLKEKDPISYQGKQCFHYVGSKTPPYSKVTYKLEAWIDAKTLLPVALDNGTSLSAFTFAKKPPTGPLVMPPAFQQQVKYYKVIMGYL